MATGIVGTLLHSVGATVPGDALFAVAALASTALIWQWHRSPESGFLRLALWSIVFPISM